MILRSDQDLIDRFNADEHRWRQCRLRKQKRRLRFPKLGEIHHLILDLRDEMREIRRPPDCVSRKWIRGKP